jgi:glycosyltransferase involved in cell wall biosynthesis
MALGYNEAMDISVIIPAYNEALRIESTLNVVSNYLKKTGLSYEILVVDDGSKDDTIQKVLNNPEVRLLQNKTNKGVLSTKGNARSKGESETFHGCRPLGFNRKF